MPQISDIQNSQDISCFRQSFQSLLEADPELESLVVRSIEKARAINPDPDTNPGQTLGEFCAFLDWASTCMPWDIIRQPVGRSLYNRLDQGICYSYFIFDQPLEELEGKGYYYPSLQYHEPVRSWLTRNARNWGFFLSTASSWNNAYLEAVRACADFHLDSGWYESPDNWHSFNDFFHRHLSSPEVRPVACPDDDAVVVLPADSRPQGIWKIGEDSRVVQHNGVVIKSGRIVSISELIGEDSPYCKSFAGGTLFHTFLDVDDYHRYHFPVGGRIRELDVIAGDTAAGGITVWDADSGNYILESGIPGWQMFETRGRVILDTARFGLVAILPVGMSQVSSVNFEEGLQVGTEVRKGNPMGWFDFGGSDVVILFQKGFGLELEASPLPDGSYPHGRVGEVLGRLSLLV